MILPGHILIFNDIAWPYLDIQWYCLATSWYSMILPGYILIFNEIACPYLDIQWDCLAISWYSMILPGHILLFKEITAQYINIQGNYLIKSNYSRKVPDQKMRDHTLRLNKSVQQYLYILQKYLPYLTIQGKCRTIYHYSTDASYFASQLGSRPFPISTV